jgi:hypothetical protein
MATFSQEQLKEIEAYILENLPKVLEQDQRFALAIERIVSEKYASKADLALLLQEIKLSREEANRRFEEMDRRFEALQKEMDRRFEMVNGRLDEHDKRFDRIEKRLDEHDKRFDRIDARFDEHDKRFDEHDKRFDRLEQKMEDLQSWVGIVVGGFQRRAGQSLENAMAGMLRVALKNPDVREDRIQLRQKLIDHAGIMGVRGKAFEFDILAQDGEVIVFEVKSNSDVEMVEYFAQKRPIVENAFPDKTVKMIFITLNPDEAIAEVCERESVILAR